jgi:hypothetical protein
MIGSALNAFTDGGWNQLFFQFQGNFSANAQDFFLQPTCGPNALPVGDSQHAGNEPKL